MPKNSGFYRSLKVKFQKYEHSALSALTWRHKPVNDLFDAVAKTNLWQHSAV
jgi:hypothetical protein